MEIQVDLKTPISIPALQAQLEFLRAAQEVMPNKEVDGLIELLNLIISAIPLEQLIK